MLGDLVPTAGVAQGLALIVAPFIMLAWRGWRQSPSPRKAFAFAFGRKGSLSVQARHCSRSLLLGRRLALVVTGGVGLDKGMDPYNGISTRKRPFFSSLFFFLFGKTEDFPKREFCEGGVFMQSIMRALQ